MIHTQQHRRSFLAHSGGGLLAALLASHGRFADAATPLAHVEERSDLAKYFKQAGTPGTWAVLDSTTSKLTVVDRQRAERRYSPASTYKIPNSLIALETGAVKDIDEIFPYDGKPLPRKEWERDMNLREAIRVSNFPLYREVARRIGLARMNEWIAKLHYGNETLGTQVDRFWVNNTLQISAVEQVRFLMRLAQRTLPMSARSQDMVHEITLIEQTPAYALHAKTGWYETPSLSIGWWVGWVALADGSVKSFALNIDMHGEADLAKRIPLGRALLAQMGILPAQGATP
ncbi:class D beta-lactamase [Variovorax sp. PAMC26660]|uniref:class D beta-lactamase n=1 Tax=Variovorax sp. PAMC26660 TaxID=2762322 RepID=UPI00164D400A|nr:class D beta-lactamase [Variovorax sp. PAMC26660]QNK65438.1 class D beta-lactamase [Variovorax sp. PAMC26660]